MKTNIPAVGYVRCSTEMQEDSPDQQKKEISAFAQAKGYEIAEWFVDFGKSGTTFSQRSEFQRLRQVVENKPSFKAVICYDESRWGRAIDPEESVYWRFHFRNLGVDVVLVKTSIDPKNEFAPMLKSFEGIIASQYSKKLSELTLRGAKNNGIYSNGGTAPYGYRRVAINLKTSVERDLHDGEWSISSQEKVIWKLGDPNEVEVVAMIYALSCQGHGWIVIAQILNDKGIPCAKRGRWKNRDMKWSTGTIRSLLQNPVYYGARVYNRLSMSKIIAYQKGRENVANSSYPNWRNDPEEWITQENAHEPIITKEVWDKANERKVLSANTKPRTGSPYLLTGLIFCSRCGFPFQGQSSCSKGINYNRYICGGYQSKRVCEFCKIYKDDIECFVWEGIRGVIATPKLRQMLNEQLDFAGKDQNKGHSQELVLLERQIASLDQKIKKLVVALEDDDVTSEVIKKQLSDRIKERKQLEEKKTQFANTQYDTDDILDAKTSVQEFLDHYADGLDEVPLIEKKNLIKKMVKRIDVDRDENVARAYLRILPAVHPRIVQLEDAVWNAETAPHKGERLLFKACVAGARFKQE